MRICIFTDSFLPYISGVSSAVLNQANEMTRRGHDVIIFHPRPKESGLNQSVPGLNPAVTVFSLPFSIPAPSIPKLRFALPFFIYTYRRLKKNPPDLIHVHTEFGCGLEGVFWGRWKKVPIIGTFHTFFAEPDYLKQFHVPNFAFTRKAMWKYSVTFFNRCSHIVSPSRSVRDHLVERGLSTTATVLSNGIERVTIRPAEEIAAFRKSFGINDFSFIYIGRISPEKSILVALDAFKIVLQANPKVTFVIVGNGPADESIDERIVELGIESSVIRTGRIERNRLMDENYPLLGDVFVTASKTENQPVSMLEAMAFGLPMVAPRAKGIPELIDDGDNGILFEPDDIEGMAKAMITFMTDNELFARQSESASQLAATHDIQAIGGELERIYEKAIEHHKMD